MRSFYAFVLALFLICGCNSRIPEPVAYKYSQQNKMQASAHWQVLAADLADRINNQLILTGNQDQAIFVEETCGDETVTCQPNETSSFNEAFRDLLITDLVGYGIPTKSRPGKKAIQVSYKVQVVRHDANRVRTLRPGALSSLSAAVLVLRNAPSELILLASGMAADLANSNLVLNGHHEIIITTSMITDDRYLFRASDIYYINDEDFFHYQEHMPQTKTIRLSGGTVPAAAGTENYFQD